MKDSGLKNMSGNKVLRSSADKTRKVILETALKEFAQNGYSATTMRKIAKTASVNLNLICHHFKRKKLLWEAVRDMLADKYSEQYSPKLSDNYDLKSFLSKYVDDRFEFFRNNPQILRFIKWQKLETEEGLHFKHPIYVKIFRPAFVKMQYKKQIRQDIDVDSIARLIASVIIGALEHDIGTFDTNAPRNVQKKYINFIVDSLYKALNN